MIRLDAVETAMMFSNHNSYDDYQLLAPYLYVCHRINNRLKNKLLTVTATANRPKELHLPILRIDPFVTPKFFSTAAGVMLAMMYKGDAGSPVLDVQSVGCGLGGACVPSVRSQESSILEQIKDSGYMADQVLAGAIDQHLKEYFEMVAAEVEPAAPTQSFEVGQAVYSLKEADKIKALARVEVVVTNGVSLEAKDLRVRHIARPRETIDVVSAEYGSEEQWIKINGTGLKPKSDPVLTKEEQDYVDYCLSALAKKQ